MADEVAAILERMDAHFLWGETEAPGAAPIAVFGRTLFLTRRAARATIPSDCAAMNPAFIRFSSGTTGDSKGVLLSHESILARTAAADRGLRMRPGDVVIWVLSMTFHFVVTILLFLRRGATIVLCSHASFPESFTEALARHRATLLYASPFHYHVLAHSAAVRPEALAAVRLAVSTAMKLAPDVAAAFAAKFGFPLCEAYGIIEVGLPFIAEAGAAHADGSVGKALPDYELRIFNPDGDGAGEIGIRGPGMFDAYVSPWQPREQVLREGWFMTGDVGRLDGDGRLFIVGRTKHVINFAGMKIFPYEVEAVLDGHPAVRESLVYGLPHPQYGQLPAATIVPRDPAAPPEPAELRRFCYARLAPYKVPKEFVMAQALERTTSGKLRRA
jgi:long-chain acyl-CoA synthetase